MLVTNIERRVLAAIQFYDAVTDVPVRERLRLEASATTDVQFVRNRSGHYVLLAAPGFASYATSFLEPPAVLPVNLRMQVNDPHGRYLPRAFQLALPRALDAAQPDTVFKPLRVALYPASAAHTPSHWARLYVTVKEEGTGRLLPWTLVVVEWKSQEGDLKGSGLTDQRGEALIPLLGIPQQVISDGQGNLTNLETKLAATFYWDKAVVPLNSLDDLNAHPAPNADYIPDLEARLDPQALEAPAKVIKTTNYQPELKIKARQTLAVTLHVNLS